MAAARTARTVAAQRSFVAFDGDRGYIIVVAGDRRPASDPIVKAHPQEFAKPPAARGRR